MHQTPKSASSRQSAKTSHTLEANTLDDTDHTEIKSKDLC